MKLRHGPVLLAAMVATLPVAAEPLFESRALVQVSSPAGAAVELEPDLEFIRSTDVLQPVVERLDLAPRWDVEPAAAVEKLRKMVSVKQLRNSRLVAIAVRAPEAKLARQLAEEVTNSYAGVSTRRELANAKAALEKLVAERREAEESLKKAEKRLFDLLREDNADPKAVAAASKDLEHETARLMKQADFHAAQRGDLRDTVTRIKVIEPPTTPKKPVTP